MAAASRSSRIDGLSALSIGLVTSDRMLKREIARVCADRGHTLFHVDRLRDLRHPFRRDRPDVLLLDVPGTPADSVAIASAVRAVHAGVPIVLVVPEPPVRSWSGFPLVDPSRSGERIVDESELAYIGIPATIAEPARDKAL